MPYAIPQSSLYGARGGGADGGYIRNRSAEQQNTTSGNPGMPIFNTRPTGGVGGTPTQFGAAMPQFGGRIRGGLPGTPMNMPDPSKPAVAPPTFTPEQQALRAANIARARGPLGPAPAGSAASYNYDYNTAPGQSPFAAAIAAMHQPKPPVVTSGSANTIPTTPMPNIQNPMSNY